jgi:hypothetical protein
LLASGWFNGVGLWDLSSNQCIHRLETDEFINGQDAVSVTMNGRYVIAHGKQFWIWELEWEYDFPDAVDWDENARIYLEDFLAVHPDRWTEDDFTRLIAELGYRGYGWLRLEGVRRKLEEMAAGRK